MGGPGDRPAASAAALPWRCIRAPLLLLALAAPRRPAAAVPVADAAEGEFSRGTWARQMAQFCTVERKVECIFEGTSSAMGPPPAAPGEKKKHILVFVVGVLERLYPLPTLRHVVAPAVRAGYVVDYYAILSLKVSGAGSFRTYWYRPTGNPEFALYTAEDLEEYLTRWARFYGARRVGIYLLPNNTETDVLPQHFFTDRLLGQRHGINDDGVFEISSYFWLFLRRLKKVEMLWNWTVAHRMYTDYDHVVWTRSDAYWVDDLHMANFPDPGTVYSRHFGTLCRARTEAATKLMSDQSIVLGARVAGQILTAYSTYYLNKDKRLNGAQGSEGWMDLLAKLKGVRWEIVRQGWMPFFLALHMKLPDREPFLCFRGLSSQDMAHPNTDCIHPSKVPHPFCDDNEIQ